MIYLTTDLVVKAGIYFKIKIKIYKITKIKIKIRLFLIKAFKIFLISLFLLIKKGL